MVSHVVRGLETGKRGGSIRELIWFVIGHHAGEKEDEKVRPSDYGMEFWNRGYGDGTYGHTHADGGGNGVEWKPLTSGGK